MPLKERVDKRVYTTCLEDFQITSLPMLQDLLRKRQQTQEHSQGEIRGEKLLNPIRIDKTAFEHKMNKQECTFSFTLVALNSLDRRGNTIP